MQTRSKPWQAARALIIMCTALFLVVSGATSATADEGDATSFHFDGQVTPAGLLNVTTTIVFDDAPDVLHQRLALRSPIDDTRSHVYEISDVEVTVAGSPVEVGVANTGAALELSIDASAAGNQPIEISYQVSGATHARAGGSGELTVVQWQALQGLDVGVVDVTGTLRIPAIPELIDCLAGQPGTVTKCELYAAGTHDAPMPTFSSFDRDAGEQVTITVGVASGAVATTDVVEEAWSLNRAFSLSPLNIAAALGVLVLGAGLLYLLFRRTGRDADADGEFTPIAAFRPIGDGESVFEVHGDVRPGHVGTVADEHVDPVDVTATLLDLAVRGHIRITELKRDHNGMLDWKIVRLGSDVDGLAEFESRMLDAIAPAGGEVLVSELPNTLGPAVPAIQDALYDDVVRRGWFASRPDATRNNWRRVGLGGLIVAAGAAVVLIAFTGLGLLALVLLLLAAGLVWVADRMPRRTKAGAKLVSGLGALSSLLATHPTDDMPSGRELGEISRLLPYAVVLGGKQRWLAAMVAADADDTADPEAVHWYHAHDEWHLHMLPASLTQFIHTVQGELFSR